MKRATKKERGWPAHYILCHRCVYHRNTLITFADGRVIVSSIANQRDGEELTAIGSGRYNEVKAFHAKDYNGYVEIDASREIEIPNKLYRTLTLDECRKSGADDILDDQHDAIVSWVMKGMKSC